MSRPCDCPGLRRIGRNGQHDIVQVHLLSTFCRGVDVLFRGGGDKVADERTLEKRVSMLLQVLPHPEGTDIEKRKPGLWHDLERQASSGYRRSDIVEDLIQIDSGLVERWLSQTRNGETVLPAQPLDQGIVRSHMRTRVECEHEGAPTQTSGEPHRH